MENIFPKFISKEIKKTENKYTIKTLFEKLKILDKKKIIKDDFQIEQKQNNFTYVPDKVDVVDFFHEKETTKNDFFKNNISNSLKNNLYLNQLSKYVRDFDERENVYENLIDELFIKKEINEKEKNNKNKKIKKKPKKSDDDVVPNFDFYKYYKIHREKAEKLRKFFLTHNIKQNASEAYSPNYDAIKKRIITAPKWKKLPSKKRPKNENNKTISMRPSYYHEVNLIDNDSISALSFRTQNNFGKFMDIKEDKIKNKKNLINNISIINAKKVEQPLNFKNITSIKKNFNSFSRAKKNNKKLNKSKSYSYINQSQAKINEIKKINQYIFNVNKTKFVNYDFIKERVKMMVNYNLRRNNRNRVKEFKGCENEEFIDPLKSFKILKGNKNNGVSFGKMSSRPSNKILPSFMSGVHSRIAFDVNMDESLKMNSYSSGRFAKVKDSFLPKSFNKYINLSLLKSENIKPEDICNLSEFKYLANKLLPEID